MATNNLSIENTQNRYQRKFRFDWILGVILVLALFLYGWQIWKAGSANAFYTAAIKSMTESFHNFWYGSFDPAGYVLFAAAFTLFTTGALRFFSESDRSI